MPNVTDVLRPSRRASRHYLRHKNSPFNFLALQQKPIEVEQPVKNLQSNHYQSLWYLFALSLAFRDLLPPFCSQGLLSRSSGELSAGYER